MEKLKFNKFIDDVDLDEYIKVSYNSILNDAEFYEVLIKSGFNNSDIKNNLSKFIEYQKSFKLAKKIRSYDDCVKLNSFENLILIKDGDDVEKRYEPFKPVSDMIQYRSLFVIKDFESEFDTISWKDCDNKSAKSEINNRFKKDKWCFLYGSSRTGKSYLSIAFLNGFNRKKNNTVGFMNANSGFKKLQDLYFSNFKKDKEEYAHFFDSLCECELLVIDDFGNEYKNEIVRDCIVFPLIQNRSKNSKMTIFTSNYSIYEISKMYSLGKEIGEIKANQMKNLLLQMCEKEINFGNTPNLY